MRLLSIIPLLVHSQISRASASSSCFTEPGYSYDALWNLTALRVCPDVVRKERVCIIGGGSRFSRSHYFTLKIVNSLRTNSGVHFGWLLKRRGFEPVLFEKNGRLGGDIWTRHRVSNGVDDDDITREVSFHCTSLANYCVHTLGGGGEVPRF